MCGSKSDDVGSGRLYDGQVAETYAQYRGIHSGVLDTLIRYASLPSDSSLLEVGCGTANYLRAIVEITGANGWGIDPSVEMLGRAGRLSSQRDALRFQVASAERLPFAADTFNLVYSVDVVHHIADLDAALSEAYRVLNPGGILITATDSEATIRARVPLSTHFPATVPRELKRYPSVGQLEMLHSRHGLGIIDGFVVEMAYLLRDATLFRERAFSCLHLISDEELRAGLERLKRDLPLPCVSRNYVLLAEKRT
ncbi:MAG: class I SAM-dependent methyltransferase [Anaerolineae bacterium]